MEQLQVIERLSILRAHMQKNGLDFYMITTSDYHNSEYVSDFFKVREQYCGFTGSNGTLVIGQTTAGLWTDGRYFIQAEQELVDTTITLYRMGEEGVLDIHQYLEKNMLDGQTIGFDGRCIGMKEGITLQEKLSKKNVKFLYETDYAGSIWEKRPKRPQGEVYALPENICGQTTAEKIKAVRENLIKEEASAFLLSRLDDLMWLFNVRGSDVACNPVALSYGFLTANEAYFFVQPEALTESLKAYASTNEIIIKDYDEIVCFLEQYPYQGKVLCDERNTSYLLYKIIEQKAQIIKKDNPTELLKAVKNKIELEQMREVYVKDSAAVIGFICWIKTNVSKMNINELTAATYLDDRRRQQDGFLDLSFPTICGYKENAAMMHYTATESCFKEIRPEGMLLVDSGGQYMGGTTDVTRTIVLGPISEEIKTQYTKTAIGMLRLSEAVFMHGCTGRNLDILARQPLWELGIDYKCGTGHGIGYILNVHEGPQGIRWKYMEGVKETVFEEGMTVSNEPGVYVEGSHGIRIENVMVVKNGIKNGDGQFMHFETLTYVPIDLDGIDIQSLSKEDRERLNNYHELVYQKTKKYLSNAQQQWLREATREV